MPWRIPAVRRKLEQFHRARKGGALRHELAKHLAVTLLQRRGLLGIDLVTQLAGNCPGE